MIAGPGGLKETLDGISAAMEQGDLVKAGAECAIGLNSVSNWSSSVYPAPDAEFQALVDAFFSESRTFLAYCSGAHETAMSLAGESVPAMFELLNCIHERLGI